MGKHTHLFRISSFPKVFAFIFHFSWAVLDYFDYFCLLLNLYPFSVILCYWIFLWYAKKIRILIVLGVYWKSQHHHRGNSFVSAVIDKCLMRIMNLYINIAQIHWKIPKLYVLTILAHVSSMSNNQWWIKC